MHGRDNRYVLILAGCQQQWKRWKPGSACGLLWAFFICLRRLCTGLPTLCLAIYKWRKRWEETDLTRSPVFSSEWQHTESTKGQPRTGQDLPSQTDTRCCARLMPHHLQCSSECQHRWGYDQVQRKTSFLPVHARQAYQDFSMESKFGCCQTQQMDTPTSFRSTPAKLREDERLALQNDLSAISPGEFGIDITSSVWTISSQSMIYSTGFYRMGPMLKGLLGLIVRNFPSSICQRKPWKTRDSSGQLSVASLQLLFGRTRSPYIYSPQLTIQPLLKQQWPGKATMVKSSKYHVRMSSQCTTATWMG